MPQSYAKRKHGAEEAIEPLRGTWDIVKSTLGVIAYQEQIMQIGVKCFGFNMNQADSLIRKIFAKKQKEQMAMLKRMFIYGKINENGPDGWEQNDNMAWYDPKEKYGTPILGGLTNGYTLEELNSFYEYIQGFADYLFNLSHSVCYSYITILTAHLKTYYPLQFMAALLTSEGDEEKKAKYIAAAERMKIAVKAPDINQSGRDFTPVNKSILYGLGSIKGVGESSIGVIIENRPYTGLEDAMNRLSKNVFDKRVGRALIKAGAFDFENPNRNMMLNRFYELRKDKDERLDNEAYDELICIEYEKEVLGAPVTYKPWWDELKPGEKFTYEVKVKSVQEKLDKNGNMMAWVTFVAQGCEIRGICFSSKYCKMHELFDTNRYETIILSGKKDDRGGCVIDKASSTEKINAIKKDTAPVRFNALFD